MQAAAGHGCIFCMVVAGGGIVQGMMAKGAAAAAMGRLALPCDLFIIRHGGVAPSMLGVPPWREAASARLEPLVPLRPPILHGLGGTGTLGSWGWGWGLGSTQWRVDDKTTPDPSRSPITTASQGNLTRHRRTPNSLTTGGIHQAAVERTPAQCFGWGAAQRYY